MKVQAESMFEAEVNSLECRWGYGCAGGVDVRRGSKIVWDAGEGYGRAGGVDGRCGSDELRTQVKGMAIQVELFADEKVKS